MDAGVVAGTLGPLLTVKAKAWLLPATVRLAELLAGVSCSQTIPPSMAAISGPPVFTLYNTIGASVTVTVKVCSTKLVSPSVARIVISDTAVAPGYDKVNSLALITAPIFVLVLP